ncbi:hypothetical protein ACFY0F_23755 [Streptomyces sp. NPDC001544]|uniref:hypothetical protein n=1 Tax=Streptomyces sp. NPDC001544 TaxID=3364584 RepID=UPI00368840A9
MGYKLRRQLREALGPGITGLQRAVALEIADDAHEDTRRSWVALEDLARWTGAKDAVVVRNALKRLATAGWEFRVPIGKGKDGRTLYAVPGIRMTFIVPPFEEVATATPKGEPPLPQGVATAHSEGATAHSEGATATPFSSDSSAPQGEETSTQGGALATPSAAAREITADEKLEYGRFWHAHPKSKDYDKTLGAWTEAVIGGADPKQITAAALAYAHEVIGKDFQYVKQSANWIRDRRYEDKHAPGPTPGSKPQLRSVGSNRHEHYQQPEDLSVYQNGFSSHARPQAAGE